MRFDMKNRIILYFSVCKKYFFNPNFLWYIGNTNTVLSMTLSHGKSILLSYADCQLKGEKNEFVVDSKIIGVKYIFFSGFLW